MTRSRSHKDSERASLLRAGLVLSGLSVHELKLACMRIGDRMGLAELAFVLSGCGALPDHRYDAIAQAINDRLTDLGMLDQRVRSGTQLRSDGRQARRLSMRAGDHSAQVANVEPRGATR